MVYSIAEISKLINLSKVLFKQTLVQPQNTEPLRERFNELDSESIEVREQMALRGENYDTKFSKRGLLNKLFKK